MIIRQSQKNYDSHALNINNNNNLLDSTTLLNSSNENNTVLDSSNDSNIELYRTHNYTVLNTNNTVLF